MRRPTHCALIDNTLAHRGPRREVRNGSVRAERVHRTFEVAKVDLAPLPGLDGLMVVLGLHGRIHRRARHGRYLTAELQAVAFIRWDARVHLGSVASVDKDPFCHSLDRTPFVDVGQVNSILAELEAMAAHTVARTDIPVAHDREILNLACRLV